nr:probable protein phosphatase 2C 27 [Ipomoea batatas]
MNNILKFIIEDSCFPICLERAIKNAFLKADYAFVDDSSVDTSSGTTALTALLCEWFIDRLEAYLRLAPNLNYATLDMLFFPILHRSHYYVLSIDIRSRQFEIIDNSSVMASNRAKYRDIPQDLVSRSWDKAAKWWDCGLEKWNHELNNFAT